VGTFSDGAVSDILAALRDVWNARGGTTTGFGAGFLKSLQRSHGSTFCGPQPAFLPSVARRVENRGLNMLCLEVAVNGERYCLAGADACGSFSQMSRAGGRSSDCSAPDSI